MDIGKNIRFLRISKELTQEELSSLLDVSVATIRFWEAGTKLPSLKAIISLCEVFKISSDNLIGIKQNTNNNILQTLDDQEVSLLRDYRTLDDFGREAVNSICSIEKKRITDSDKPSAITSPNLVNRIKYIPYYSMTSAAGYAFPEENEDFELIPVDDNIPTQADFAVKIQGESMMPYIHDGDIVFVKRTNRLLNGEVGIFSVDGALYCKQFYKNISGEVTLASANPKLKDSNIFLGLNSKSELKCFGKVLIGCKVPLPNYLFED